jgi:hypothetical protein
MVVALEFESRLARRIVGRHQRNKVLLTYAGAAVAIFLVVNFTTGSLGAPHAVIQIGSHNSIAKYLGQYDGRPGVLMLGVQSAEDWVCVKLPFKGRLADVSSISFSEFVDSPGGMDSLEPYVVIRMSEGRTLVCHPSDSYVSGEWWLPLSEWQFRDMAVKGRWTLAPVGADSTVMTLSDWQVTLGTANVMSINLYTGSWDISSPFISYIGDLAINGNHVSLSNLGRCSGSPADLPQGF